MLRRAIWSSQWKNIRLFTTSSTKLPNGITLSYDLHPPAAASPQKPAIVILHGLFGSKANNKTISRVLARDLGQEVYALDLRNHGASSHSPEHDYSHLAMDVELFLQEHGLSDIVLIGHSMGAKTAMTVALRHKVPIGALIPVDNAPVDAALKGNFGQYVQAMRRIADANLLSRSDADAILKEYEGSLGIRQFLLTNLIRDEDNNQTLHWRIPVSVLGKSLNNMADFPFKNPEAVQYNGPTLIVRGTQSPYVADEMLPVVGRFFPKFELADIDCGHWVISEKPQDFRRVVVDWLRR
ncbi:alpha beta hydrolase fold family [Piedraia hortae CBS 480.64]|uniref:Alpha beta hydrolase fold family n=1 Tax=Piedraia hortae CBS 480.64 TaxID=1314780 RepID=A0A6A7C3Y4_9PEZI|nr:alpha beta hydrolase fold family [Piedraia hortae CBS 480.64]